MENPWKKRVHVYTALQRNPWENRKIPRVISQLDCFESVFQAERGCAGAYGRWFQRGIAENIVSDDRIACYSEEV